MLVKTSRAAVSAHPFQDWCGPEQVFMTQYAALAIRMDRIGAKSVTIGLSGGLDSTLCLLVAVEAFKILRLPRKSIKVYTMPGFGTTGRTRGNAETLCEGLGLKLETIDIRKSCLQHFRDIGQDPDRHDVTYENAQARMRTMILMDKANQTGGIVLGTGDMSEIALGWCTYNGDHMSMFGVNAGVPKTVVRDVCRWWAEGHCRGRAASASAAIMDIIDTPVSPELLPAAENGEIAQQTESLVGPYELHDFYLYYGAPLCTASAARRSLPPPSVLSRGSMARMKSASGLTCIADGLSRSRSSATARLTASRCFRRISGRTTGTYRPTPNIAAT